MQQFYLQQPMSARELPKPPHEPKPSLWGCLAAGTRRPHYRSSYSDCAQTQCSPAPNQTCALHFETQICCKDAATTRGKVVNSQDQVQFRAGKIERPVHDVYDSKTQDYLAIHLLYGDLMTPYRTKPRALSHFTNRLQFCPQPLGSP